MTDTGYLYEYFLKNSEEAKSDASNEENNQEE